MQRPMNETEVITLLKKNQSAQGIKKWHEKAPRVDRLKSFGIGLTALRKLAKQIGKDHVLALKLWESEYYDAKIIALLIDDPKLMTRAQIEVQVEELDQGHLVHVFSSCGAPLAKTTFVVALAHDWIYSKETIRRCCGYGLLYELSKSKKKNTPNDGFFLERIAYISKSFEKENRLVKGAMGGALLGIGKRSVILNTAALKLARAIGPIQIGSDKSSCAPFDVEKHLTSNYIKKKLGI